MKDQIQNNRNNIKGFEGEQKFEKWLETQPLLKGLTNIEKAKTGSKGIDFTAYLGNKKIAIQVKNYSHKITSSQLHSFLNILKEKNKEYNGGGIFVNFGKGSLTNEAKKELEDNKVTIFDNALINDKVINYNDYKLRDYQNEAVEKAVEHYKYNNRGLLHMACGTGKTFVSKHIMKKLLPEGGIVFYFVPWISLLEQSAICFNDPDVLIIPIYSKDKEFVKKSKNEETFQTDIMDFSYFLDKQIFTELKHKYKYLIFFCTYQSHDKLAQDQKRGNLPEADLIICDEAHHTTYEEEIINQNSKDKNLFANLHKNIKSKKVLFMTATVKILYKQKNKEQYVDMTNKDIYGDIFYSLDLGTAIEKDILCDYDIISSKIVDAEEAKRIDKKISSKVKKQINELVSKKYRKQDKQESDSDYLYHKDRFESQERLKNIAKMVGIYKTIQKRNLSSTSIAFVNSIHKNRAKKAAVLMQSIIKHLNKEQNFVLNSDYIEGIMNAYERKDKLDKLINQKPFVLWNCRCLTEGVDIPSCDTVIFFDAKSSSLEITQAIGRILRKDPDNPNKKATIILLPFENDSNNHSMKNISLNNKDFLNTLKYILINDGRFRNASKETHRNILNKTFSTGKETGYSDQDKSMKPLDTETKKINSDTINAKDRQNIDFCMKYIRTEIIKISGLSWKHLVLDIKNTLIEIEKIIKTESKSGALEETKKFFGAILNIDESFLETKQTAEILAQYILFYPILEKIYKVECTLFQDLDELLERLGILKEFQNKAQGTINSFYRTLDFEYKDISKKEHIFTQIYNDLLKAIDPKLTAECGMWYTPDWVVKSLWELLLCLDSERLNATNKPYHVIDPASGTASFMVYFIKNILSPAKKIDNFYSNYLHIREINFVSFMVSVFRIAIAANKSKPPKNVHWGDTLKNESKIKHSIVEQHKSTQKDFTVIITNPPWRGGQIKYEGKAKALYKQTNFPSLTCDGRVYWVDEKIEETFIALTDKKNKRSLYNMYRRFVRWGLDHIKKAGWLAMILPNSFLTESVEGFRRSLTKECQKIYLVDLRGAKGPNVPYPEKEGQNIFQTETQDGNRQGVVLLLCFKNQDNQNKQTAETYYHLVPDGLANDQKKDHLLKKLNNFREDDFFQKITLDKDGFWFDKPEKEPLSWQALTHKDITEENKRKQNFYFKTRDDGYTSACNEFLYDNNKQNLIVKMKKFIAFYNECRLNQKIIQHPDIKWHDNLQKRCQKNIPIIFDEKKIIQTNKKPFDQQYFYLEPLIIERCHQQDKYYQTVNLSLCINYNSEFFECLVVDKIPDSNLFPCTKCYPISELILQSSYKPNYKPEEWFAILYALFHHNGYRTAAKNFLKKYLPTVPYLTEKNKKDLLPLGQKLMKLHLNYETLLPSQEIFDKDPNLQGFIQYKPDMPFVSEKALAYQLCNKPLLYTLRKSPLFPQLVNLATQTTEIRKEIDKIKLNLD